MKGVATVLELHSTSFSTLDNEAERDFVLLHGYRSYCSKHKQARLAATLVSSKCPDALKVS